MARFSLEEILHFAVELERNGETFYREAAQNTDDVPVRDVFLRLAREEVAHEQLFGKLLAQARSVEVDVRHDEDYLAYLRAFVANVAFRHEAAVRSLKQVRDADSAIRFALQREQDSILFYTELRELVPEDQRSAVDEIISEERAHFLTLSEILDRAAPPPSG